MKPHKPNTDASPIVVNELNIRSVDRTRKDIGSWRNALSAAEAIHAPNRARLYDLYADVLLDGHLTGVIAKRADAVLNKELLFEVANRKVPDMQPLLQSMPFRQLVRTIVETQLWGISGVEFLPGSELALTTIPRKHIRPDLQLITWEQGGDTGVSYADMPQIWIMGYANDLGLLLKCAPYALYKRGGLADWAEYVEIFGQPVRIIKYDSYDPQTKAELRQALEESGSSLAMMLPRQVDFEMLDGKQSNSDGNLQLSFIKALNDEMSIIILGNTETTSTSNSTGYAQSKIHLEQQYEITRSDLAYVAAMLNSKAFMAVLASYGYPVEGGRFRFAKDMDVDYLASRIAIDREVAQHIAIPEGYWYDTYGITEPHKLAS
jgi:hypothetical protein